MILVPLKDFCKMYQPSTISTKEMVPNGKYVVYGANGPIGRYDNYNHEEPQLLVTCRGATCGAVNMSEPFAWVNGNAMVIQPDKDLATLEYMKYAFLGGMDVSSSITGSAQPQITRTTLEVIKVPLPSLSEQKAIVEKLDAAFAEIDKLEANLETKSRYTSELLNSFLDSAFPTSTDASDVYQKSTRTTVKFGDLVVIDKNQGINKGMYVGMEDIESGTGRFLGSLEARSVKSITFTFGPEHILYGRLRPYLNKVLLPEFVGHCSTEIFPLRVLPSALKKYLFYWLTFSKTVIEINRTSTGARMPRANVEELLRFEISLPSLAEQKVIVEKLDVAYAAINELSEQKMTSKESFLELRQSILSSAFAEDSDVA